MQHLIDQQPACMNACVCMYVCVHAHILFTRVLNQTFYQTGAPNALQQACMRTYA
jgi:hypothetical protein